MAADPADDALSRPRPAPEDGAAYGDRSYGPLTYGREPDAEVGGTRRSRAMARRQQVQAAQAAQAAHGAQTAGGAVVTAARVGRLLGRTGWRIARQVPGVSLVEAQALRLGQAAVTEFARMVEAPQQVLGGMGPTGSGAQTGPLTADEHRAMLLTQGAGDDPAPLRTAMGELLQRSAGADGLQGRDYLFGSLVSQLVPDEARILAAMAGGKQFAAMDVTAKSMGRPLRTVFANASTVSRAAGITRIETVATYLTRLHGLGLLEFGDATTEMAGQFESLEREHAVREARSEAESGRMGGARIVRKSVGLSALGREFWSACAPPGADVAAEPLRDPRLDPNA